MFKRIIIILLLLLLLLIIVWKMVEAYATALTTRVEYKELTENGDSVLMKGIRTAFTLTVETHEKESFMQNFCQSEGRSNAFHKYEVSVLC